VVSSSWIIAPWFLAFVMTRSVAQVLHETPTSSLFWTYAFGVLWGLGGLTFGSQCVISACPRYGGRARYTAVFGTLMPPIFRGEFRSEVLGTSSGRIILVGVVVCLLGIIFAGAAGMSKEKEMSAEQKRASIKEFDLKRGLFGRNFLWNHECLLRLWPRGRRSHQSSFCEVRHLANLAGCFGTDRRTTRRIHYKLYLVFDPQCQKPHRLSILCLQNPRRRTRSKERAHPRIVTDAPGEEMAEGATISADKTLPARAPMLPNYFFSAVAGTTWYFQFFFYTMGETQMGRFKFSSWTLHMASIIIFSTLCGNCS